MLALTPASARLAFSPSIPRSHYNLQGSEFAQVRNNQQLPLEWSNLTAGDLGEIRASLFSDAGRKLSAFECEARLAIECILTVGRSLMTLSRLQYFPQRALFEEAQTQEQQFGLIKTDSGYLWVLPAGNARRAKTAKNEPRLGEPDRHIDTVEIQASELTVRYFEMLPRPSDHKDMLLRSARKRLANQIKVILKNRKPSAFEAPRPISDKVKTLERYLSSELVFKAGGDRAEAIRQTDKSDHPGATVAAYHLPGDKFYSLSGQDDDDLAEAPPTAVIKAFIAALKDEVEASRGDTARHHFAFVNYTVELLTFCTGARGNHDSFPSSYAVDQDTGFCQFNDKGKDKAPRTRLGWIIPTVLEQLKIYGSYLRYISATSPRPEFQRLQHETWPTLVFPDAYVPATRVPIRTILNRSRKTLRSELQWNVARHWLRTHLLNRCSTETIHAFLGHWLMGMEPWSYGSFLDPLAYRAELKRVLPQMMAELGWEPIRATVRQ